MKDLFNKAKNAAVAAAKSDEAAKVAEGAKKVGSDVLANPIGKEVAAGAAAGAVIGSMVPLVGTVVGAQVGAAYGLYKGITK